MKKESIWKDGVEFKKFRKVNKDMNIDVLIIGGGISGISTAYQLKNSGFRIALVERNKLMMGVTCRTTGKLTYLQENIYSKIKDKAFSYYCSQKQAIKLVKDIVRNEKIDCDLKKSGFCYLCT